MSGNSLHNQPFLVAEDLSAVGTMSLGVAIPILAALGVPAAILPTQVLSTQTEGFGTPAKQFSTQWLKATTAHWQAEEIQLSGGLIGYVGEVELLNTLTQMVLNQRLHPLIVDPVMGDDGALYPGLSSAYVTTMQELVSHADVITPNWTEARLLAGKSLADSEPTKSDVDAIFTALTAVVSEQTQVVITGIPDGDQIKTVYRYHDEQRVIATKLRQGHFYGSGDVFSALLAATIMRGASFEDAVKIAVKGDVISLDQTSEAGYQRRFGMQLGQLLAWLSQKVVPLLDTKLQ